MEKIKTILVGLLALVVLVLGYQVAKLSNANTALQINNDTLASENSFLWIENGKKSESIETKGVTITTEQVENDPSALDIIVRSESGQEFTAYDTIVTDNKASLSLLVE